MRMLLTILLLPWSFHVNAEGVITCGDAMSAGAEAKALLHNSAQNRAQKAIEEFTDKKLKKPYIDILGQSSTPETTALLIQVYWCGAPSTPLHAAYYRLYSTNKDLFE